MSFNQTSSFNLPPSIVIPTFLVITDITQTNPMVVTVSTPNNYVVGQLSYFSIPFDYGMFQLDGKTASIISVDTTNLVLTFAIDATQFDAFVIPGAGNTKERPATLSPAGSRNIYNFTSLPFHSLANVGN